MKVIYTFISVVLFLNSSIAQYRSDIGLLIGEGNYLGQIGGNEQTRRNFIFDMKLKETRMSTGIFARHRINESYGFTATLNHAIISGDDKLTSNPARKERNLNFTNHITELNARVEYYFYSINDVRISKISSFLLEIQML